MNKPLALLLFLGACGQATAPAGPPPLAGARIGGPFALIDGDGATRTDRDFAGRWRIMYFGYTFCPDVCPTDMQVIGTALRQIEARAPAKVARIVPLFVTIDPARDTPAVVKQFARTFHPRAVGLTGSAEAIARISKEYAVYAKRGAASPAGGYLMDHSRQVYLMAPDGSPVALLPTEQGAAAVAAEIDRWVR
jgi:protein SCO1/2